MHLPGLVLFCIGGKDIGDMNANNMLERALACAAKGWLIFPCGEDKRPRIKWSEGATNKELEIRRLWRQFPNALVGVVTGKKSRLYVVDVDNPERLAELGLALSWGRQVSPGGPADALLLLRALRWQAGAQRHGQWRGLPRRRRDGHLLGGRP